MSDIESQASIKEPEEEIIDVAEVIKVRREKLKNIRKTGCAYPNDFHRNSLAADITATYAGQTKDALTSLNKDAVLAGRIMAKRIMGKASFVHIQDMSGKIQIYLNQNELPPGVYDDFKTWDIGDIIGVEGKIFKTKTDELSIFANKIRLLTKSLRPLPDKYHGLVDQEIKYRQRYLDLIVNSETRNTFKIRSKMITAVRDFLTEHDFVEVETPMMQVLPGGAAAKPFVTHHNALDMPLYLRIAPELYLKRLVVGGIERVFEINRNFRNEGVSTRHNPEFTMLEYYQAYADYNDAMDMVETLLKTVVLKITGKDIIQYQGHSLDFCKKFERITVVDSILKYNTQIKLSDLQDRSSAIKAAKALHIAIDENDASIGLGKVLIAIFDETVETKLIQPTFITQYPTEVSPLSRVNDHDPNFVDRPEFFCAGRELANLFSELNDPEDQAARFLQQVKDKEAGDEEAMPYDEDYVTSLEYGLPPTAGVGIGIDRLAMLLTDSASIRDVILFPHMRDK